MATDQNQLTPTEPVRQSAPVRSRVDPHIVLWRDSATILVGVVLALLGAQVFLPKGNGGPTDSGDLSSGVVIGSLPPGYSLPPGVTFGPILNPSLGIDATPTPIPVITLGPETPSPSAKPTPKASKTPGASGSPTDSAPPPSDSPAPPTDSPPPPTDTPPPPDANFTWIESSPCVIDFTNASIGDTSWDWDFGDLATSTANNPTHTYLVGPMTYSVSLTINGTGGPSITKSVDVVGPCP